MSSDTAINPPRDREGLAKPLKVFDGVKKVAVAVAVLVLAYNTSIVIGRGIDSSTGASDWFHLLTILLVYKLADGGSQLSRHIENSH